MTETKSFTGLLVGGAVVLGVLFLLGRGKSKESKERAYAKAPTPKALPPGLRQACPRRRFKTRGRYNACVDRWYAKSGH